MPIWLAHDGAGKFETSETSDGARHLMQRNSGEAWQTFTTGTTGEALLTRAGNSMRVDALFIDGRVRFIFWESPEEWVLPDCGHPIDCADRRTEEGLYGRAPVEGPEGQWRCFHVEHLAPFPIPMWAGSQP
ncbi:hypothetical protein [Streptomyces noursei]